MYPDCLKNLVGIGELECSSYTVADDISTTGLFVTQDPTFNMSRFKSGDTACELAKLFLRIREEACMLVATDIAAVLSDKVKTRVDSHYTIGQTDVGPYLNSTLVPAVPNILIQTEYREGAYVEIQKVALILTPINGTPFDLTLRFIRQSDLTTIKQFTFPITTYSKQWKSITPFRIPCDGDSYVVEYDYDSTKFMVPESYYHCGCSDRIKNAAGFLVEQVGINSVAVQSYGIAIYTKVACDSSMIICQLLDDSTNRMVVGYMLRKKIIELTLQHIYFKQEVNKFTLLSSDDMVEQMKVYESEYALRLTWIGAQKSFNVDGFCLTCAGSGMRKFDMRTGR